MWILTLLNCNNKGNIDQLEPPIDGIISPPLISETRFIRAREFCISKQLSTEVAFFMDMSLRSGRPRFYVIDLDKHSITTSGLVAHGHCQNYTARKVSFSNEIGSNCTSEGRYKVSVKYTGKFGISYKLHGLDSTNSHAFERFVVLHSHTCVPDKPTLFGICRSEGCPTVSPRFFTTLESIIDKSKKPVLLWIYKSKA